MTEAAFRASVSISFGRRKTRVFSKSQNKLIKRELDEALYMRMLNQNISNL
jgi:hypothetical protein